MSNDSDYRRIKSNDPADCVTFSVDGVRYQGRPGENLAAAMLATGHLWFRRMPGLDKPRGPWCMMGACYECVVRIDGVDRQACMSVVVEGMQISRNTSPQSLQAYPLPKAET